MASHIGEKFTLKEWWSLKNVANLHLNKTICTYIIVLKHLKIQYLKRSARRGTSPIFYMCVIECVVVSMFEFTVNEATTSSY